MLILQAQVTKTSAFNGAGVDISSQNATSTVRVKVDSLSPGKVAVLAIQDSVDAFDSDIRTIAVKEFLGQIETIAPQEHAFPWFDIPSARFGVSSATMRAVLLSIDGSASITYESFIQP